MSPGTSVGEEGSPSVFNPSVELPLCEGHWVRLQWNTVSKNQNSTCLLQKAAINTGVREKYTKALLGRIQRRFMESAIKRFGESLGVSYSTLRT